MHEFLAAKNLIELTENECSKHKIQSPKKIIAELGSLQSYKKDPIIFYFEILKKESPVLQNCKLDLKEITAKMRCKSCKKTSVVSQPYLLFCGYCNSNDIEIICGKDFKLKKIIDK
jgi:hydrogenase nickel incorporation protein HypA/HybF